MNKVTVDCGTGKVEASPLTTKEQSSREAEVADNAVKEQERQDREARRAQRGQDAVADMKAVRDDEKSTKNEKIIARSMLRIARALSDQINDD